MTTWAPQGVPCPSRRRSARVSRAKRRPSGHRARDPHPVSSAREEPLVHLLDVGLRDGPVRQDLEERPPDEGGAVLAEERLRLRVHARQDAVERPRVDDDGEVVQDGLGLRPATVEEEEALEAHPEDRGVVGLADDLERLDRRVTGEDVGRRASGRDDDEAREAPDRGVVDERLAGLGLVRAGPPRRWGPATRRTPRPRRAELASTPRPGPRRFAATHATASASPTSRTVKCPGWRRSASGIGSGPASIRPLSSRGDPAVYMRR